MRRKRKPTFPPVVVGDDASGLSEGELQAFAAFDAFKAERDFLASCTGIDARARTWLEKNPVTIPGPDPRSLVEAMLDFDDAREAFIAPELGAHLNVQADFFEALAGALRLLERFPNRPLPPGWKRPDAAQKRPARAGAPADAEKARRFALFQYLKSGEDPCKSCAPIPIRERLSWARLQDLAEALGWGRELVEDFRTHAKQDGRFDRFRWEAASYTTWGQDGQAMPVSGLETMLDFLVRDVARVAREAIRAYEADQKRTKPAESKDDPPLS